MLHNLQLGLVFVAALIFPSRLLHLELEGVELVGGLELSLQVLLARLGALLLELDLVLALFDLIFLKSFGRQLLSCLQLRKVQGDLGAFSVFLHGGALIRYLHVQVFVENLGTLSRQEGRLPNL